MFTKLCNCHLEVVNLQTCAMIYNSLSAIGMPCVVPTDVTPAPTVKVSSQTCVESTQEVATVRRQGSSTPFIAVSAILAVLFLLALLIIIVLILWVLRLNKQLSNVKGIFSMRKNHYLSLLSGKLCTCMHM